MPELYSPKVLENYRNPKNFGRLENATHRAENLNPMCGDEISVYLKVENSKIADCRFEARGCALSIAAASVLSERIKGMNTKEVIKKVQKSTIEKMLGIKISHARESCLTLALNAIIKAIN